MLPESYRHELAVHYSEMFRFILLRSLQCTRWTALSSCFSFNEDRIMAHTLEAKVKPDRDTYQCIQQARRELPLVGV